MTWHFVNAMIWESETHRIKRVGERWFCERKIDGDHGLRIGDSYSTQDLAQSVCEGDQLRQLKASQI